MAAELRAELGDDVTPDERVRVGLPRTSCASLQDDLGRIGVHFDTWFSERTLHERGEVADVLDELDARRASSTSTTAPRWLRTTDFGDQRDRVLVEVRRLAPRISATTSRTTATSSRAGWTHLIDIWGADHHGQVKSLQAGMEALGFAGRRARGACSGSS